MEDSCRDDGILVDGHGLYESCDVPTTCGKHKSLQTKTGKRPSLSKNDIDTGKEVKEVRAETTNFNDNGPSFNHEVLRRKAENDAVEFWYYMRSELKKAKAMAEGNTAVVQMLSKLQLNGSNIHISILKPFLQHEIFVSYLYICDDYLCSLFYLNRKLLNDMHSLKNVDGTGDWREKESQELGDLVQRRLQYLQNPKDCSKAKKILCNLGKGCGYGCQLHHVTYCMIIAYANQRTLILESKGWRYAPGGWETVFQPLSTRCTDKGSGSQRSWGEVPIIDSIYPRPNYLPLAIPKDLSERLIRLHGDPSAWWIGQIVKYLTRPQKHLTESLDKIKEKLNFKKSHCREYFDRLADRQEVKTRNVYLATDDSSVINDARKNYPSYNFINDPDISKSAGLTSRYTDTSLHGVIADIHFLSLCDYLVCTFSSQVCRVAYEMMQTMHGDVSQNFKSLDDIYYFGGQNAHDVEAIAKHVPQGPNEIELMPGDTIGIAGNHWDGFSKGLNRRTGKSGLYPSYKVKNKLVVVDMPTYSEVGKGS
ncbi:hypothetical protein KUTeg_019111 [Tegillarca granosa]|uniref:Alpha-(1,6)-fucosyltransferase n=1 Tax=Tegillarca granosa TaxID=220873 RepID=A0ABQ9EH11_TEGGR|nr:hypothetical protein KUTeg_019111 [Tegillarca granosa]